MGCSCREKYEEWIGNKFGKYGSFVARGKFKPWIVMIVCVVVNVGLTMGLLRIESLSDIEELYTPRNSEASKNRKEVNDLFSNQHDRYFNQHALSDLGLYGEVIFRTADDVNILNVSIINQIKVIDERIRTSIEVNDGSGKRLNFSDLCATFESRGCVVDGDIVFDAQFLLNIDNINYPIFQDTRIAGVFGNRKTNGGILERATMIKLRYNLRDDEYTSLSKQWELKFEETIPSFSESGLDIAFVHSNSRNTELGSSTTGDIKYFSVTFTLMITYASIASIGLNMNTVAWRPLLSLGGVLATILAIGAALGFASLIGLKFVSIVGAMPFLVVGIGIDDVFILMSGMADACGNPSARTNDHPISQKLYLTLKSSGIAITITSLTDFLAFGIGASSVFLSVQNFCITTGLAVLFCYFNQLFFFVPCIVINERRVEENRHFFCCIKRLKAKDEDTDTRSRRSILCCSGHLPQKRDEFDGPLEKFPKIVIKALIRRLPCRIIIFIFFMGYLGLSIYGVVNLKQGLELRNLATTDSYYYKYTTWDDSYFREDIPVSFVVRSSVDYSSENVIRQMETLLQKVKQESNIISNFEINWLTSYQNTPLFNSSDESAFISSLRVFLNTPSGLSFNTDLVFDSQHTKILASRFYVLSDDVKDSTKQGKLMLRMRELASESDLPVFAYSPAFIFFEQYVQILPATLQTVGIAIAVMFFITAVFMPQPLMVLLVTVTLVMILVGIFGFMYFWDLTLSSITMIHLVMTVGFSVDFSAHICHAYLSVSVSDADSDTIVVNERHERVEKAIDRSGGPIINAALSSIIGILMLTLSSSYIFQSFFKMMFLVILFGLTHSILLLPIILWMIGPKYGRKVSPMPSRKNSVEKPSTTNGLRKDGLSPTLPPSPSHNSRNRSSLQEANGKINYSFNGIEDTASDTHQPAANTEMKTPETTYSRKFNAFFYCYR
ncbi:hypothetical protein FSP39_021363 [Pinctada imbricata]|uniref:SSD domain-containing protein n=1 Tax=Pinctada imbricata TaxID=66713 RepID=A0AA88Y9E8_PINIB|nr:hypothetical protein FSP39_021363 [Pinctada imbricata]